MPVSHTRRQVVAGLTLLVSAAVGHAESFRISVTRKAPDLFWIDRKAAFVLTRRCDVDANNAAATLTMKGHTGTLFLEKVGISCKVTATYTKTAPVPGKYNVEVRRQIANLYELINQDIYIQTSDCNPKSIRESAVLKLPALGLGELRFFDTDEVCVVSEFFTKTTFN